MSDSTPNAAPESAVKSVRTVQDVTIRFAGDSGDGMQLAGTQFTDTSAMFGNDISTLPDFPAEIRAPAGTLAGVSGYQIHFSSNDIFTAGDDVDVLVAMNPAALRTNLASLLPGGILIVNEDAFTESDLRKAKYERNPLEDQSLNGYRLIRVPIDVLTAAATADSGLGHKDALRCRNMFALGLCYWLYSRPLEPTLEYIQKKFSKKPVVASANSAVLRAGYNFGITTEIFQEQFQVPKATLQSGTYRKITGNEAVTLGIAAAARLSGKRTIYCGYPITPASDILHGLATMKPYNVVTFQAEDEIAAIGAAIGVSFGGELGVTGTSGPGMALKGEAIGLAVMTELPLVIINVQRGGPSTGLPTKTEQADLFQALFGRNGECPVPVIAADGPGDCFYATIEAFRLAVKYMTPVVLLSDGYAANSAEPWRIPDVSTLEPIVVKHPTHLKDGQSFEPYRRDANGARPWAIPGTAGFEHRIGGLEKQDITGAVSYDAANHEHMVQTRAQKVARLKPAGESFVWTGPQRGELLIVGWGSTFGAIKAATLRLQAEGVKVAAMHLRYLNPLPQELESALKRFDRVLVPEMNLGQLRWLLRAKYLRDVQGLNKVRGQPFTIGEIADAARALLDADSYSTPADQNGSHREQIESTVTN